MAVALAGDDLPERLAGPDPVLGRAAQAELGERGALSLDWLLPLLGRDKWSSFPRIARLIAGFDNAAVEPLLEIVGGGSRPGNPATAFRFLEPNVSDRLRALLLAHRGDKTPWDVLRAIGEHGYAINANDLLEEAHAREYERGVTHQVFESLEQIMFAQSDPAEGARVVGAFFRLVERNEGEAQAPLHPTWHVFRAELGWLDAAIALVDDMPSAYPWRDARVMEWLGISRAARAVPVLERVASNPGHPVTVRAAALEALADTRADGALEAVARVAGLATSLPEEDVARYGAAVDGAIARLAHQADDPGALARQVLDRATQADDYVVRAHALRAVGRHGGPEDVEPVIRALTDSEWFVRGAAASALGWLIHGGHADANVADPLESAYRESGESLERIEIATGLTAVDTDGWSDTLNGLLCEPMLSAVWALLPTIRENIVLAFAASPDQRASAWRTVMQWPSPGPITRPGAAMYSVEGVPEPDAEAAPAPTLSEAALPEPRPPSSPPAQADTEATQDQLGRDQLVNTLVAMLSDETQGTPFTFGLFGGWGEGKSSVLRQLCNALGEDDRKGRFHIGWFNAWQYEKTDNLAAGLVQESVLALQPEKWTGRVGLAYRFGWKRHPWKIVWAIVLLLLSIAAIVVAALGGTKVLLGAGLATVASVVATIGVRLYRNPVASQLITYFRLPSYTQQLGLIPAMREELRDLWEVRRKDERERLLIVVDDLDRCSAPAITATLDAVRLVMDMEGVIVIIALDDRICLSAVAHEYKDLTTSERAADEIARDFVAKIVQLPIRLGPAASLEEFIAAGLFPEEQDDDEAPPPTPQAQAPAGSEPSDTWEFDSVPESIDQATPGYAGQQAAPSEAYAEQAKSAPSPELQRVRMRNSPDEQKLFRELAAAAGVSNPRQLRRLRNAYRFVKAMYPALEWNKLMTMMFCEEVLHALTADEYERRPNMWSTPQNGGDPMNAELLAAYQAEFDRGADAESYSAAVKVAILPRLDPADVPVHQGS